MLFIEPGAVNAVFRDMKKKEEEKKKLIDDAMREKQLSNKPLQ